MKTKPHMHNTLKRGLHTFFMGFAVWCTGLSLPVFGGQMPKPEFMVAVTRQDPSMEWWYAVPRPFTPNLSTIRSAPKGEYFCILPIFKSYGTDSNSTANITYDIEVVRPDGSIDVSLPGCIAHHDIAQPPNLIPSQAVVRMCFDPEDPFGTYKINVTAYDHVSGQTNSAATSIEQEPFKVETLSQKERERIFVEYPAHPNPSKAFAAFLQTTHSFFNKENEPIWSAIWFYKTVFENNEYLIPHLLKLYPGSSPKQKKDIIMLLALLDKLDELPRLSSELRVFKRVVEAGRVPNPYATITNGRQLDMLWAEYFATGRVKPIRQVLEALELVEYVGTLEKIKNGGLDKADPNVYRQGMLEAVFQSALWSLRSNCAQSPLVLHYCYGILEAEELEKPAQSCLALLLKSLNEDHHAEESK